MLQIISGRFFGDGKVNQREQDAILYANYSWVAPITTCVAELRPVDTYNSSVASYVARYTCRYEIHSAQDILVLPNADEAVEQLRILASFYFCSFFHVDRTYVESMCRTQPKHGFDTTLPAMFVPKVFDLGKAGTHTEVTGFPVFIDKVLSMPRLQYRLVISCLAAFFGALEAVATNFDLAYSMLVYVLEALSKASEPPTLEWSDYDQNMRWKLDKALDFVDAVAADRIRGILLHAPHLKLKSRFIRFIDDHLDDTYFTGEAAGLQLALAKSEVRRVLGNLYDARSGFVHELRQVQTQLRLRFVGTDCDVFTWQHQPHLTFAGLVRMARHVLATFIARQPVLAREDYPAWRAELPGIVQMQVAPEYWVWQSESFSPPQARRRFGGFIEHLLAKHAPLDLRPLMARIEVLSESAKPADRVPMLALYWLFNSLIRDKHRQPGWDRFLAQWPSEMAECSIELLMGCIICGRALPWPAERCAEVFENYQGSKHRKDATNLPRRGEVAIMAEIANLFLDTGQVSLFEEWMYRAMLDAAGLKDTQEYVLECQISHRRAETNELLFESSRKERLSDGAPDTFAAPIEPYL